MHFCFLLEMSKKKEKRGAEDGLCYWVHWVIKQCCVLSAENMRRDLENKKPAYAGNRCREERARLESDDVESLE